MGCVWAGGGVGVRCARGTRGCPQAFWHLSGALLLTACGDGDGGGGGGDG